MSRGRSFLVAMISYLRDAAYQVEAHFGWANPGLGFEHDKDPNKHLRIANRYANLIREALKTLFENDEAASRSSGSIEVQKLYWWEHNNKNGSQPSGVIKLLLLHTKKILAASTVRRNLLERVEKIGQATSLIGLRIDVRQHC